MRFNVPAQSALSFLPTGVDPVNVSFRTIGLEVISSPISDVTPHKIFITPAGIPARFASSPSARADKGV